MPECLVCRVTMSSSREFIMVGQCQNSPSPYGKRSKSKLDKRSSAETSNDGSARSWLLYGDGVATDQPC